MKSLGIILLLTLVAYGGEQEVWYNADGVPVRVTEEKDKSKAKYVPPWVRREEGKQYSESIGKLRWDQRRSSRYSRDYYVYPGWYGGWTYPRYQCYRPHFHAHWRGGGVYYRRNGVRFSYSW